MRTTTVAVANAIRMGVQANFEPKNQADAIEKLSEMFLEMAASIEMDMIVDHVGLADPDKKKEAKYSDLLGEIGWSLDRELVPS